MRAYLAITGTLFALLALLHLWRIVAEWHGFDSGVLFIAATAVFAGLMSYWGWRLFAEQARG
jgi:hypothetical protein